MSRRPAPRLFVITAASADAAVVLRRGPSSWFHVLQWDTARDTFESGAWFRGRIYPEKCDLSPDGRLLLYFVHQGNKLGTEYSDAWTAVSRSPWLTALGLWPQGTTYGGGGRFASDRHVILRAASSTPHPDHPARGLRVDLGNPPLHAPTQEVEGAEWSGRDHAGDIIFTKSGRVFRRTSRGRDRELIDLNDLEPDPRPSPSVAGRPLQSKVRRDI
jgi:hypothetical protein